ncbi:MAG: alginate lyase family protein [Lentisphaeria bacterium]|nr:alginate lyase family protein [Lentisphaeria bacterium]
MKRFLLTLFCGTLTISAFTAPVKKNIIPVPNKILWQTPADDEFSRPLLKPEWRDLVLAAVNWDHPGLEKAKKLYSAGDKRGAANEFANYLRARKIPAIFAERLKTVDRKRAYYGVNYIWTYGANSHQFPDQKFDWFFNKTKEIPGMTDFEWHWQLNRMRWFKEMAAAYRQSKDDRWAIAFVRQLRSWAAVCGVPPERHANGRDSIWRGIEQGLRLGSFWAPAFYGFLDAKEFTNDDIILYCYLGLIQSRHLQKYPNSGNIYVMEMNGILTFNSMFPEFKESKAARRLAIDGLYTNVNKMLLPDGFLNELTNSYHGGVISDMLHAFKLANDCGVGDELPKDFIALLERAYDAQLHMMTPAFDMPLTNDSRHTKLSDRFDAAVKLFPHRKDFLWVQSNRKKGTHPPYLSTFMPWAGFVILRESWDKEASYLCFDIGPLGMRHQHQDKLNIAIWKGQDMLLYDDGGGSYARSMVRKYTLSSLAHNLVSVDGLWQSTSTGGDKFRILRKPLKDVLTTDGKTDYTRGIFDQGWGGKSGNKIVLQERQIVYLRPNIFIVLDRMIPVNKGAKKPHTYQARWHVDTLKVLPALKDHPALITTPESSISHNDNERARKNRNRLIVAPLFTQGVKSDTVSGKVQGNWPTLGGVYAVHPYRVTTTITHTTNKVKGEHRFLTMFVTLGNKEANPLKSIVQKGTDGADVEFTNGSKVEIKIINNKLSAKLIK